MAAVRSPLSLCIALVVFFAFAGAAPHQAHAQPTSEPDPPQEPEQQAPADDEEPPPPSPPPAAPPPSEPVPSGPTTPTPEVAPPVEETPPPMSEGRMLVSLYNSGFQWGIAPGVVFSRGKAGFALGVRFGYGFDTGPVILVPGVRLSGYFIDPNVYIAMPTFKLVLPIDRFAPFIEGGAGLGHVAGGNVPAETGAALMGGGGFMIHFTRVAFGAEASYQVITGTPFKGFGVGPILAIGF